MLKKYIFRLMFASMFLVVFSNSLFSQTNSSPRVVFESIQINGKAIPKSEYKEIVIGEQDSLSFKYSCKTGKNNDEESYLFRVMLKNQQDSSIKVTGVKFANYKNLPEDTYTFTVGAFDLKGSWNALEESVTFKVNNEAAKLKKRNLELKSSLKSKDSLLAIYNQGETKPAQPSYFSTPVILSFAGGIILTAIIAIIIAIIRRKTRHRIDVSSIKSGATMAEKDTGQGEVLKLKTENSNLRAEIASLRGQIDALQARGDELRKRNTELEESVNKLSSTKDELEQLQTQKDELFAVIIHDIKNPAALIKSLVELLRSYDLTATEQQEIIEDIAETTIKIVALSHEVSRILALEGSKLRLDVDQIQVGEIVKDIFNRNMIAADNKNIEMLLEIEDEMPLAECDPQKIDEVIENLVSNAIKFTQKGGKVRVKAHKEGQNIQIEVRDNGLGLSQEDINHAFKRGSRLSATPTGGESSTGLGLWIVKKLIEAHHGRVWVKSALGKGSTFFVAIPLEYKGDV